MRKFVKFLFTPQTDSPTVAYYAGMLSGVVLTIQVAQLVENIREQREWERQMEALRNHEYRIDSLTNE